jgi:hypothetical protein
VTRERFWAPALILVAVALPGFPLGWPVQNAVVTGTFGEDRGDHFHAGIDVGGGAQEVHPVLPGELVFRYDEGTDYSSVPRGTGSLVILRHAQDILTEYAHLAPGSLGPSRVILQAGDPIGITGDSGRADGIHLHFSVFDGESGAALNPLGFLPPVPDRQPPVIRRVILAAGDQRWALGSGVELPAGRGEQMRGVPRRVDVLAEIFDLREDVRFSWRLAPWRVSLFLDGVEAARVQFESLQVTGGKAVLAGSARSRADLYTLDGLLRCGAVDLRAGFSRMRLVAQDIAGNEAFVEAGFTVNE